MSWLIMSDFNCVKSPEKKQLGVAPTEYELKDFVDCYLALGLLDAPTTGYYNTWSSTTMNNSRSDCIVVPFNPPGCLSDHSPGGMECECGGHTSFSLCSKLKALKGALKAFNNQNYSHISVRAKEAYLVLQVAQCQLESNLGDVALWDSLGDLRKKQRSISLKRGTGNTKSFHDMLNRNVARNSILTVTKEDGSILTAYISLLGTEVHTLPVDNGVFEWGPELSFEHTLDLCRAITLLEIKETIFQISENKAPDPDGYSSGFFKIAWNVVGDQVYKVVIDFFSSGRMLRQLNYTIIAFMPKSYHSTSLADYLPISCCNVIYKVITKIISDQLAPALEHLIDRCQVAFVGDRNIIDNIFLA
ncbi:UNVERIFIED_CONTAM: hypothetical protein Sindi_2490100 [Sesamum indicum]